MDFAIDSKSGEKIFPSEALRKKRYLCPCCKNQVTVRALESYSNRSPHFAHLKGKADKDCENFFSSISRFNSESRTYLPLITYNLNSENQTKINKKHTKNLYLIIDDQNWNLYFSFEIKGQLSFWAGQIVINGLLGDKTLESRNIFSKHEIQVKFDFNKTNIKTYGYIDENILNMLVEDLPCISGNLDIFHAPVSSGRLLNSHDRLSMGEDYIVCSSLSLKIQDDISNLIEYLRDINGNRYYQIRIPPILELEKKESLERLLLRKIYSQRPQIKLLTPLPQSIKIDGTVLVPENVKLFLINFDCNEDEIDVRLLGGVSKPDGVKVIDSQVFIDASKISGVEIFWSNYLMLRIEKKYQKFNNSFGVNLLIEDQEFNLVDSTIRKKLALNTRFSLSYSCPEIVNNVDIKINELNFPDNTSKYSVETGLVINAESFGYYEYCIEKNLSKEIPQKKIKETLDAKDKWLRTLALLDSNWISNDKYLPYSKITNAKRQGINHLRLKDNFKDISKDNK